MKKLIKKLITTLVIVFLIILSISICLITWHPMMRTVEPQTITYIISDDVDVKYKELILIASENAFTLWEKSNPELIFKEGDGGMNIVFLENLHIGKDGLAICPGWNNSEDGCYIFISIDVVNVYPYNMSKNHVTNILAHEIGHVLGMMHIDNDKHLMNGVVLGWNFDDRGYNVPTRLLL